MILYSRTPVIEAEHKSELSSTENTPYLALTGKLWVVYCEDFRENWPCYNGTALYLLRYQSVN